MHRAIAGADIESDRVRIDNAMQLYGFKFAELRDGALVYRAEGVVRRIILLFEDEIIVRHIEGGIEVEGKRRQAVRIIIQLSAYIDNKRFE
jgi:hypothetical protein